MKNLMFIALVGLLLFAGCKKDEPIDLCEYTTCFNDGHCVTGTCDCPEGWTGSDCSTIIKPKSILISKIEISNFPATKPSGSSWDIGSGADLMIKVLYNSTSLYESQFYENASPSLTYSFTPVFSIFIENVEEFHTLQLYDYDTIGSNELMAQVVFKPWTTYYRFPEFRDIITEDVSARIWLTYSF